MGQQSKHMVSSSYPNDAITKIWRLGSEIARYVIRFLKHRNKYNYAFIILWVSNTVSRGGGGVALWVARRTRNVQVVGLSSIKGIRCVFGQ